MSDYNVEDYGIFSNAVSTTKAYNSKISTIENSVTDVKTALSNTGVFMGPFQEECIKNIESLGVNLTDLMENFSTIEKFLIDTSSTYKSGDQSASQLILGTDSAGGKVIAIPQDIVQAGYTVTCYGEGGWYLGGGDTPTSVAAGTKQKRVHESWLANGARYKNGIAVINVDGVDHYLIATSKTLGNVGDNITVHFENGQSIPCIIADAKSSHDSNYTSYGHSRSNGSVNILEFEVDRNKYNSSGNPKTATWGLEWDSSSDVAYVTNYGTRV